MLFNGRNDAIKFVNDCGSMILEKDLKHKLLNKFFKH